MISLKKKHYYYMHVLYILLQIFHKFAYNLIPRRKIGVGGGGGGGGGGRGRLTILETETNKYLSPLKLCFIDVQVPEPTH